MYNGPHRKNLRLKNYDYSQNGFYFVTICTKERENYFGEIIDGKIILNDYGKIAEDFFKSFNKHFKNVFVDEFVIMPNHIHGIVIIDDNDINLLKNENTVGNADLHSLQENQNKQDLPEWQENTKMLLSKVIHGYKSSITREIRKQYEDFNFGWQKSFFDVIIKNDEQLEKTREYILNNPLKWELDVNNKKNEELVERLRKEKDNFQKI